MASETREKAAGIVNTTGKLVGDIKNTISEPEKPEKKVARPKGETQKDDNDKEPQ